MAPGAVIDAWDKFATYEVIDYSISGHPVGDLAGVSIGEGDHGETPGVHAFKNLEQIQNRDPESFALLSHMSMEIGVGIARIDGAVKYW